MAAGKNRIANLFSSVFDTPQEVQLIHEAKSNLTEINRDFGIFIAKNNVNLALKLWIWISLSIETVRVIYGTYEALNVTGDCKGLLWYYVALYSLMLLLSLCAIPFLLILRKNMEKHYAVIQLSIELYMLIYLVRSVCFMLLDAEYGFLGFSLVVAFFISSYSLYLRPWSSAFLSLATMSMLFFASFFVGSAELFDVRLYLRILVVAVLSCFTAIARHHSKYKSFLVERSIIAQRDALEILNAEVEKSKLQIEMQNRRLQLISVTDPLTGLANRRAYIDRSKAYIEESVENNTFITVAAIDIDDFKKINDTTGHAAGDNCLMAVAKILKTVNDENTVCYRIGGDEFTVVFAGKSKSEAFLVLDRVLKNVSLLDVPNYYRAVTLSIGIYSAVANADDTMDGFLEKADKMLYRAKENGKNRIEY